MKPEPPKTVTKRAAMTDLDFGRAGTPPECRCGRRYSPRSLLRTSEMPVDFGRQPTTIAPSCCPGGGIGRRAGFRYLWPKGRGSSSLLLGTIPDEAAAAASDEEGAVRACKMNIELHQGDLPADLDLGRCVAVDTETMGLNPLRDRLCLVQLSSGDGVSHLVRIPPTGAEGDARNLKALIGN